MTLAWKPNWEVTQQHMMNWWNHQGSLVSAWAPPNSNGPHEVLTPFQKVEDIARFYIDPEYHADYEHHRLTRAFLGGDIFPIAETDIGPGSLALYLGSEAGFARDTVWFNACLDQIDQPIRFDPENRWWKITEATLKACMTKGKGKYLVGCPDLVEGLDVLASLRGTEALLIALVEQPEKVMDRLEEINQAWFEVFTRVYDTIHLEDGSSAFGAFRLWGPGRTAKLQCDASAMLSPRMFKRFVVPFLAQQCAWLDQSMYHLDGHQCLCHLDALLQIDGLDAIEWTPDPTVPSGGDPTWYPLYRKILENGKSVQAVGVKPHEVQPLFENVGTRGLYLFLDSSSQAEFETAQAIADSCLTL